jgi:hypothetical protein
MFNVPIALISLVDIDRQWFKSRFGLSSEETHRDFAFCAYVVLRESPDVLVVCDATEDPRFQNNPLVTGNPFIRFYAGAAIYFEEQKLGTLCVIDTVPRHDFSLTDKMNLLDLAAAISTNIRDKVFSALRVEVEKSKHLYQTMQNFKSPLSLLEVAKNLLAPTGELMSSALPKLSQTETQTYDEIFTQVNNAVKTLTELVDKSIAAGRDTEPLFDSLTSAAGGSHIQRSMLESFTSMR